MPFVPPSAPSRLPFAGPRTLSQRPRFHVVATRPPSRSSMPEPAPSGPRAIPVAPDCIRSANALVIGGGPAGSMAAAALHARRVPVTIIERVADFARFDVCRSYCMRVDFRGRRALHSVPGLYPYVEAEALSTANFRFCAVKPDGNATYFSYKAPFIDTELDLCFLRPGLLHGMKNFVTSCAGIRSMYGAVVKQIEFASNGEMTVLVDRGGEQLTLKTKLLLACDGIDSVVARELSRKQSSGQSSVIASSNGLGESSFHTPAVGLRAKSVVLRDTFAAGFPEDPERETLREENRIVRILQGSETAQFPNSALRVTCFPIPQKYVDIAKGQVGTVALKPSHKVWGIQSIDEAYRLFQENFPHLNVRDCVPELEMQKFLETKPTTFGPSRRRDSLVTHVGEDVSGGVIFLGDAAHSFPPDLGQGVNSALQDVHMLSQVLDSAQHNVDMMSVLRQYESVREDDTIALVRMHIFAGPYQYSQSKLGLLGMFANAVMRNKLATAFPGFLYPSISEMIGQDLSYSEIMRRADVTTARIFVGLLAALLVPIVASILVAAA